MRMTKEYALIAETPFYWDDLREYMEEKNVRLIRVKGIYNSDSLVYYFRYC